MSCYRIFVRLSGKQISQGTGWLLRSDLLVTAFHVVGKVAMRRWYHEGVAQVTYHLSDELGNEVPLHPLNCDIHADVALLRPQQPMSDALALALAPLPPQVGAAWRAIGYPDLRKGAQITLTGKVVDLRGDTSSTALQLLVDQGTTVSWAGASGSAVCDTRSGRVIGIITQETNGTATGWAAAVVAVDRLQNILNAQDLLASCRTLLMEMYPDSDAMLHQWVDLGWPVERAGEPSEPTSMLAARLVERAALEGANGLLHLLNEVQRDFPGHAPVDALRKQVMELNGAKGRQARSNSRKALFKDVLVYLSQHENFGVALQEPLGFDAQQVVDDVLHGLTDSQLLPIRLVPDKGTTNAERLYKALLRDLRRGLERHFGQPLPKEWSEPIDQPMEPDSQTRFEMAIEYLLDGPVKSTDRKLLLVIQGMARVPMEQLRLWGQLLSRLTEFGLRLLVWGGRELYDLRTQADETSSAFHKLTTVYIGPLSEDEVRALGQPHQLSAQAIRALFQQTGGHPALVREMLGRYVDDVRGGDAQSIAARLLVTEHLYSLRQAVGRSPDAQRVLGEFAKYDPTQRLPRNRLKNEDLLFWFGILRDSGSPVIWDWTAPVMLTFAKEWSK